MSDEWEWKLTIEEAEKFSASQPRVPAGQPDGGQWTSSGETAVPTKATYRDLKRVVGKTKYVENAADLLSRASRRGELPRQVDTAVYGIAWARQTGRLSGTAEMAIRKLDVDGYTKLVADIAKKIEVSGDVPAILNEKYQ